MRLFACALGLCVLVGTAYADEPRTVPAVGTKLTYRLISTTTVADKTISTGQIYTYIVTSSDAATAEGVIKPTAIVLHCDKNADVLCENSAKAPGARYDGDMLTVPIASDAGDGLAKQSYFKLVHFLTVSRKFPVPTKRDPEGSNFGDFGPDPAFVIINTEQCDKAGLESFLPFGKSPKVSLDCETTFERTASRDGHIPAASEHDSVAIEITYAGNGWITVPSGSWQVQKLASKTTPKEPNRQMSETEILFSTQLGALVRSHLIGTNPTNHSTTENTVELISVAP